MPVAGPGRLMLRGLGVVEQAIGILLLLVILVLVLIQVGQRYLPGGGWPWTGEIARFALVWVTFLLAGHLMAQERHITIHVVDQVLRGRALRVVKTAAHIFVLVTSIALAYATYDLLAADRGQVTPAASIPLLVIYTIPLVGFALVALRVALFLVLVDLPALIGRKASEP
jgi:TRAP-type transport system small permease protein